MTTSTAVSPMKSVAPSRQAADPNHHPIRSALLVALLAIGALIIPTAVGVAPASAETALGVNQTLAPGQAISSGAAGHLLAMQGDGNLVVVHSIGSGQSRPAWASGTAGRPGSYAVMQGDGNLVVYQPVPGGRRAVWASNTSGRPGSYVVIQDDGNLVIYQPVAGGRRAVWASNTSTPGADRYDEFRFLDLINRERRAAGLSTLKMSSGLVSAAEGYSARMVATGTFTHSTAIGSDCSRVTANWTRCGENIGVAGAGGTTQVADLHRAFMNSASHRANVLLGAYDYVGIGVRRSGTKYYVTVRFMDTPSSVAVLARPAGI